MVLVTGANGFVGQAVCRALLQQGESVTRLVRRPMEVSDLGQQWVHPQPDFVGLEQAWPASIRCEVVIHLAARVHVMRDSVPNPLDAYRETNVQGTLRVARAARAAGASRFVYVSSIKAVGERSTGRAPLGEFDVPAPEDPYGISKLEAEHALTAFGQESGMEIVIVRPPLIYGPGVRANYLSLMRAISRRIPLPLGAITARRSMVFIGNLASALTRCVADPRAAGEVFHVTDGRDLAVRDLVTKLGACLGAPARLVPVPAAWLRVLGRLTGRLPQIERLIDTFEVDSQHIQKTLGWHPPYEIEDGLKQTAAWFLATR
jgi:nucleoside-diphosphate-sugar epimerase